MANLLFGFPNNVLEVSLFPPFSVSKTLLPFSSLYNLKEKIRREGVSLEIGFGTGRMDNWNNYARLS